MSKLIHQHIESKNCFFSHDFLQYYIIFFLLKVSVEILLAKDIHHTLLLVLMRSDFSNNSAKFLSIMIYPLCRQMYFCMFLFFLLLGNNVSIWYNKWKIFRQHQELDSKYWRGMWFLFLFCRLFFLLFNWIAGLSSFINWRSDHFLYLALYLK